MIEESEEWYYMPRVDVLMLERMVDRVAIYYYETYKLLHEEWTTDLTAPNTSVDLINENAEIADPLHLLPRLAPGFIYMYDDFCYQWGVPVGGYWPVSMGAPPAGYTRLLHLTWGLLAWQAYRLHLGQQTVKLTSFYRRGRPEVIE